MEKRMNTDEVIIYPKEFRKKVEEVYPYYTHNNLHYYLDKRSPLAIELLRIYAAETISRDEIIAATSLKELKDRAKLLEKREELYLEAKGFLKD